MIVTILPYKKDIFAKKGDNLLNALCLGGFVMYAPCGGNGTCNKCKVRIVSGEVGGGCIDENGYVNACKTEIVSDLVVEISENFIPTENDKKQYKDTKSKEEFVSILDLGTTTLVMQYVHLKSNRIVETLSELNPQSAFGGDVMSRIEHYKTNGNVLTELIIKKVGEMMNVLSSKWGKAKHLVVCANTVMLHIFAGISPLGMGEYPYEPIFTNEKIISAKVKNIGVEKIILLPSATAFIGSDAIACLVSGALDEKKIQLIVDVGTNGEIMLNIQGKIYATSVSAGPALEGATIECGSGAFSGAIKSVSNKNKKISLTTIGNTQPKSICGSGLVDAIAVMLELGILDERGTFVGQEQKFYVSENVFITQKDVRQFQLVKGAIASGINVLMQYANINIDDVDEVLLAGVLGNSMSVDSIVKVGLLPRFNAKTIKLVGNLALKGALNYALNSEVRQKANEITKTLNVLNLATSDTFQSEFLKNMDFINQ